VRKANFEFGLCTSADRIELSGHGVGILWASEGYDSGNEVRVDDHLKDIEGFCIQEILRYALLLGYVRDRIAEKGGGD
jgi:hypothetical protein